MSVNISNGDVMLYLLDTGRMAHKFGKWRGALYLLATALPLALSNFIAKVFSILPGQPQPLGVLHRIHHKLPREKFSIETTP
ncbi:MAG: hypothetical protein HUU13_11300 [Burkholderiaceae bacterium]|nr:hypothetical protein [Burkholderiaceae bacterium]